MAPRVARWLPALTLMGAIFFLSGQSAPLGRSAGTFESVVAHLALYAGLGAAVAFPLRTERGVDWPSLLSVSAAAFVLAAAYGLTDELHQAFVPGRVASLTDFGLDAAGSAIGASLAALCHLAWEAWRRESAARRSLDRNEGDFAERDVLFGA